MPTTIIKTKTGIPDVVAYSSVGARLPNRNPSEAPAAVSNAKTDTHRFHEISKPLQPFKTATNTEEKPTSRGISPSTLANKYSSAEYCSRVCSRRKTGRSLANNVTVFMYEIIIMLTAAKESRAQRSAMLLTMGTPLATVGKIPDNSKPFPALRKNRTVFMLRSRMFCLHERSQRAQNLGIQRNSGMRFKPPQWSSFSWSQRLLSSLLLLNSINTCCLSRFN